MRSKASRGLTRRAVLQRVCAWSLCAAGEVLGRAAHAAELRVGESAPEATLVTLDGRRLSTTALKGQVVILTFWATWCVPCRDELPLLSKYATDHAGQGLTVLGFSLDTADQLAEVRKVAQALSFPVGLLERSSAPGYGRIWRLPVSFTIDRAGRLAENGWKEKQPTWTAERLEQVVTPLLTGEARAATSGP
jgi:cytochrome c biogenesis protein CcmG/thiol:disulfide interchange protein DsbE